MQQNVRRLPASFWSACELSTSTLLPAMVKKRKQTEKPMKYLAIFMTYPKRLPRLLKVWLETIHSLKRQLSRTSQIKSRCPLLLRRVGHRLSLKSWFVYTPLARSNLIVCARGRRVPNLFPLNNRPRFCARRKRQGRLSSFQNRFGE